MNRILLDVDGVLADFAQMAVDWVNAHRERSPSLPLDPLQVSDVESWDILAALGYASLQDDFDEHCNRNAPGRTLRMYGGARLFHAGLKSIGEVVIVTSPFKVARGWEMDRRAWLAEHFDTDPDDVVFTKRKELVRGDVLIDDGPHNIDSFPGPVVIIDRPWNQEIADSYHPRVRCRNYVEALAAVKSVLERKP
jgi:5'-nucleotidase